MKIRHATLYCLSFAIVAMVLAAENPGPLKLQVSTHESAEEAFNLFLTKYKSLAQIPYDFSLTVDTRKDAIDKLKRQAVNFAILDGALNKTTQEDIEKSYDIVQMPILTGGVGVLQYNQSKIVEIKPIQLCGIFTGSISEWKDIDPTQSGTIKVHYLDFESGASLDLTTYLKNEGCNIESSTIFKPPTNGTFIPVKSYQEMTETASITKGAIGYSWFKANRLEKYFQVYVDRALTNVLPTKSSLEFCLMQLENVNDFKSWNDFTLTDMKKMPLDQSCMAMPPYPITRFLFLVTKKDQSGDLGHTVASFIEWISRDDTSANAVYDRFNHLTNIAPTTTTHNLNVVKSLLNGRKVLYKSTVPYASRPVLSHGHKDTVAKPGNGILLVMSSLIMFSGIILVSLIFIIRRAVYPEAAPRTFSIV